MKWILAQLNRPFFCVNRILFWSRASSNGNLHISLALGSHDEFSHISAHTMMRHMGSQKAFRPASSKWIPLHNWSVVHSPFALRSCSLTLTRKTLSKKNLLHFMPCHDIIAGLGDTFRACGEERSQMNRGWTQFGDARQIENGPRRLESISQRWRHTCNGCCATHARSRAVVSSFVRLFGVSMNHRRKMTFIAGSKSALGWQSCRVQMNPLSTEFIAWLLLGIEHCL